MVFHGFGRSGTKTLRLHTFFFASLLLLYKFEWRQRQIFIFPFASFQFHHDDDLDYARSNAGIARTIMATLPYDVRPVCVTCVRRIYIISTAIHMHIEAVMKIRIFGLTWQRFTLVISDRVPPVSTSIAQSSHRKT